MTKTLFYGGQPGEGYGWGVCNKYLIQELGKLCSVRVLGPGRIGASATPVFLPIADHDLNPIMDYAGSPTLGYCFFEFPLGPKAAKNAKRYDLIFCGSTWCKERLAEIGVHHTEVLVQGVDHEIFKPEPIGRIVGSEWIKPQNRNGSEFRIFSGGKFEYRKGQDIVLAAFKLLQDKYPEMRLVCAWENLWPRLCLGMGQTPYLRFNWSSCFGFNFNLSALLTANDIDPSRVTSVPKNTPQSLLADIMRSTDLGVFPNRCEGGTNLVLMEYLACGKPAIASLGTGHLDIFEHPITERTYLFNFEPLHGQQTENHWTECSPEDLAAKIVAHYKFPSATPVANMSKWTWRRAAEQIVGHL